MLVIDLASLREGMVERRGLLNTLRSHVKRFRRFTKEDCDPVPTVWGGNVNGGVIYRIHQDGTAFEIAGKKIARPDSMIAALKHCLRIRNKYAHAYWHDPNMGKDLCYVSLEELAKENDAVRDLTALTFFRDPTCATPSMAGAWCCAGKARAIRPSSRSASPATGRKNSSKSMPTLKKVKKIEVIVT